MNSFKRFIFLLFLLGTGTIIAQSDGSYYLLPELLVGKTSPANKLFPETGLHTSLFFSIGNTNEDKPHEWVRRLNKPSTGISIGFSDFGNRGNIGNAFTVMPFAEFDILPSRTRLKLNMGLGISRFSNTFDLRSNRFNRGISTQYNWSFRSYIIYDLLKNHPNKLRLGIGYFHQSNGHTKLPNQGLNTFTLSVSSKIFPYSKPEEEIQNAPLAPEKFKQYYFSIRTGIGQNILTYDDFLLTDIEDYNEPKEVYTIAIGGGVVINKFLKLGAGLNYRFYEHYYDYIQRNETEPYINSPFKNATNFSIFLGGELLLSHVGLEFQMGVNVYKPFYEEEWLLNEEELNWYYELKKHTPVRMGVKLYALNTSKQPKHNVYLGATINANLGQADFSELSIGYVRRFDVN
ncbi:deacylase [Dokdonia sinensis]|uniref:Deacylase n=1 Tax=Dokdonia sinensis TaxID=2479847 RepID=A0A3M0G0G1_9FLAO|nr:acyloxyacyl hydrolase [Dokdonia sinensis]RMB57667.1 deacylase [Dokdonia sinensis]